MRGKSFVIPVVLLVALFAGCLTPPDLEDSGLEGPRTLRLVVSDGEGTPLPFVQAVALVGEVPVAHTSTDPAGNATLRLPPGVDGLVVYLPGHVAYRHAAPFAEEMEISLAVGGQADPVWPVLAFREPLDLGSQSYLVAVGTSCLETPPNQDCGLGEPSIEVDAQGVIYLSGVCCIGAAPPVLVSRDDGLSFTRMETPLGLREAFGIEGDFAIDADGVMYFVDIELAATFQVTAWDQDGAYLHHTKWPAPPLVDRPWLRAEGSGKLYYVYNTGSATNVYTSEDGGRMWSATPRVSLPYALGNAVKGPAEGELWVVGGNVDGNRRADVTYDGGTTWETETTSSPAGGNFPVGFFDEAGDLYLVSNAQETITVARRDVDATWHAPMTLTPGWGTHRYPWIAAGGEGQVAVAWYGTLDDEVSASSEWFLFVAVSVDAADDAPHWALAKGDAEPVFVGNLQRELLDFLQVEIGPAGTVHVGYSKVHPGGGHEQLHYLQSLPLLSLAPQVYPWGPQTTSDDDAATGSLSLVPRH